MSELCHLCHVLVAVTSDGVCSVCEAERPLEKRPPSAEQKRIADLEVELSIFRELQEGCPSCVKGDGPQRTLIDEDGCSVGDKPKQWGHAWDDYHWFCADAGAIERNATLQAERDKALAEVERLNGVIDHLEAKRAIGYCKLCGRVGPNLDCESGFHVGKTAGDPVLASPVAASPSRTKIDY